MNSEEQGPQQSIEDIQVDVDNLYREENFTDLKVASIRRLMPVKADGSPDESREPIFVAQTHLMSQMGPLPVQAQVEAKTLEEVIQKFPEAIGKAVEEMMEEVQERRRQEASRIVVPGAGGLGGGQKPGGGIQLGR
ncbi:MAG: hypothetical protein O2954_00275 [bacterium]|nr:hypothetical protein [bacterium]